MLFIHSDVSNIKIIIYVAVKPQMTPGDYIQQRKKTTAM